MSLRRHRTLLILGVLVAALLAAFLARAPLLEIALKAYLAQSGDETAQLKVLHVGIRQTTIGDVKTKWLRASRIIARYAPNDLLRARVALLEVDGLALDLDLRARDRGEAFRLPPIPPIALSEAAISAQTPMGPITISADGRTEPVGEAELRSDLVFRGSSRFGEFDGRVSSVVGAEGLTSLDLDLEASAARFDDIALGRTTLDLELRNARWSARASSQTADGDAKIALRGGAVGTEALRDITIELDARIDGRAALLKDLAPGALDAKEVRVGLSMNAAHPPTEPLPATSGAWVTALADAGASGTMDLSIAELKHPASRRVFSTEVRVTVAAEDEGLIMTLPKKVVVSAQAYSDPPAASENPDADWEQLLADGAVLDVYGSEETAPLNLVARPTPDGGVRLTFDGTARLSASQDAQVWLRAKGDAIVSSVLDGLRLQSDQAAFGLRGLYIPGLEIDSARFEGSVAGEGDSLSARGEVDIATPKLGLGDLRFRDAHLSVPIEVAIDDRELRLSAVKPGSLRWRQAGVEPGMVRLPDDFSLGVSRVALHARGGEISYQTHIEAEGFTLSFAAQPRPIDVELRPRPLTVKGRWLRDAGHHSEVNFGFDRVTLPAYGITAAGLQGREVFSPSRGQERLAFSVAEIRSSQSPPHFGAFSLNAAIDHSGTDIRAEAKGTTLAGRKFLDIKAVHSRSDQAGSAKVSLDPPLGGAEPFALNSILPAAGDLILSSGQVTGAADLSWSNAGFASRGRFELAGVSLESGRVSFGNLNGEVVLDSLFPPKTATGQRVTAEAIEVGRKLRNLDLTFVVAPADLDGDIQVKVLGASVDSEFGPLALESGTLIPDRGFFDLRLQVIDMDLEALSDWASIQGLAVTGDLSGLIPLRVEGGRVSIEDAILSNTVKGRIAFRSEVAAQALAAGGEPAELMLRALEDFQYEKLVITAQTAEDEDTIELLVSTLGKNPDVLEGHPFQFNIRLTGDLPQLLDILGQGSDVAGGILGRMWRLKP